MNAYRLCAGHFHDRLGQFSHLLRAGIANGIGDGDEIDPGLETFFDQFDHFPRIYRTRDRTTQRHRYRGIDDRLVRARVAQLAKPLDVGDGLLARPVRIGLAVLLGGRDHRSNFSTARGQRLIDAAFVQRQRNAVRARQCRDRSHDLAHVGELRKPRRRQERADLEMPHARAVFVTDPALLRHGRRKRLYQLQAVSQTDLAQGNAIAGINILDAGHASLTAVLPVEENSCASSSDRTADVSAPSTGTFNPSPILAPFHSIGSAGTRNASPSALVLLTRPPGRSTCGSSNRSSGRLIGEKQILSRSSVAERSAAFQRLITSATRGMIFARARIRSVVVRKAGSSENSCKPNSRQKLCQWPSVTTPMKMRSPPAVSKIS